MDVEEVVAAYLAENADAVSAIIAAATE